MDTKAKLELLKQSNQVSNNTFDKSLKVLNLLKDLKLLTESNEGSMFVIHFAKALQRIENNEPETQEVAEILNEINEKVLQEAKNIAKQIEKEINVEFKKGEVEYILMYLSALIIASKGE